jgi:hypothetical protein
MSARSQSQIKPTLKTLQGLFPRITTLNPLGGGQKKVKLEDLFVPWQKEDGAYKSASRDLNLATSYGGTLQLAQRYEYEDDGCAVDISFLHFTRRGDSCRARLVLTYLKGQPTVAVLHGEAPTLSSIDVMNSESLDDSRDAYALHGEIFIRLLALALQRHEIEPPELP